MNRSSCPISSALDLLGDKWSLLVIRDVAFFGKHRYGELLSSDEGIATNVLSNRLNCLEKSGVLQKHPDPKDGRKFLYFLTEAGKDLVPILIEMIIWSAKHHPEELTLPDDLLIQAKKNKEALIEQLKNSIDLRQKQNDE